MFHIYQNLCLSSLFPWSLQIFFISSLLIYQQIFTFNFREQEYYCVTILRQLLFFLYFQRKKKLAYLANQSRTKVQFFHAHSVLLWNENNSILNFPSYNKWPRRKNHRSRRIRTPRTPIPCAHAYLCSIIHIRAVY